MSNENFLAMEDLKANWHDQARALVADEIKQGLLNPEQASEREAELYAELERIGLEP